MKNITKKQYIIAIAVLVLFLEYFVIRGYINIPSTYSLFGLNLRFYGLTMTLAILFVAWMFENDKKNYKSLVDVKIEDLLLYAIIPGFIGARIYHVLADWHLYAANPMNAFNIFGGGLGILGAIVGGVIGIYFYVRRFNKKLVEILNLIVLYMPIAQFIGRIGNMVNQEIIGKETSLPWGWVIKGMDGTYHPLFYYEQIALILLFILLNAERIRNYKYLFVLYVILYFIIWRIIFTLRI